MQIKVLQFNSIAQQPPVQKQQKLDSWLLIGNLKSPQFHQCLDLLYSGKEKNLLDFKVEKLNPFDFIVWKQKNVIQGSCQVILQLNGKNLDFDRFCGFCKSNYAINLKEGNYENRAMNESIKDKRIVELEISIDKLQAGTLRLYDDVVPVSVNHFLQQTYAKTKCTQIVKNGWIQFGGKPTTTFPDENFIKKHTKRGIVSLVNSGPNSNSYNFMILLKPMPYFDKKFVVIGELVDGDKTLDLIEQVSTNFEKPDFDITIEQFKLT
ncbi:putative inactive peptidyl-prolyl cis-trans isomerase-like 6 [Terramyces sp. JEL0728]|nr:putative inactive peptidyl-prolyl cis-trans isomerase-like 6 [Terramyces sp. JEL0728]